METLSEWILPGEKAARGTLFNIYISGPVVSNSAGN